MSQSRFYAEMKHLAQTRPLVTMGQISDALQGNGGIPDGAVAVTLDDGYLNNYREAWPVLESCGVPATIYIATGYISTGRMMWTDHLEALILGTQRSEIDLPINDLRLRYSTASQSDRINAFLDIKSICKAAPNNVKDAMIDALANYLDSTIVSGHPLYAFMEWDHIREMDSSRLIDFGAHTVDHVSLAKVPASEMRDQIDRSCTEIEHQLGHKIRFFSYPEGQADDFDENVIRHLSETGFDHAPTAIDGVNNLPGISPFRLFRTMVGFEGRPYPFESTH